MPRITLSRPSDLLLGTEPKQRLRLKRSLMAANVFVACIALQADAVSGPVHGSTMVLMGLTILYKKMRSAPEQHHLRLAFADFVLTAAVVPTNVLARWGGEEFLLLRNDTALDLADASVQHVREAIESATLSPSMPALRPTFSTGLTRYHEGEPLDVCIERADHTRHDAKGAGRRCTVIKQRPAPPVAGLRG